MDMRYLQLPMATPQEQVTAGLGPAQECEAGRHELQDVMSRMIVGRPGRPNATHLVMIYYLDTTIHQNEVRVAVKEGDRDRAYGFKVLFSFFACEECANQMQENLEAANKKGTRHENS